MIEKFRKLCYEITIAHDINRGNAKREAKIVAMNPKHTKFNNARVHQSLVFAKTNNQICLL